MPHESIRIYSFLVDWPRRRRFAIARLLAVQLFYALIINAYGYDRSDAGNNA
jgi:hypothetical protein